MAKIKSWWKNLPAKPGLIGLALVATIYGGTKGPSARVVYPVTDSGVKYLTDTGSYVTNDHIYISFARTAVPASAALFIDRCNIYTTNMMADTENFLTTTFEKFSVPATIPCPNATNWNWYVYTDWTPGPTVQTNGVWEVIWMTDRKGRGYIIPARTAIIENGERISPDPAIIDDDYLERLSTHKSVLIDTLNESEE